MSSVGATVGNAATVECGGGNQKVTEHQKRTDVTSAVALEPPLCRSKGSIPFTPDTLCSVYGEMLSHLEQLPPVNQSEKSSEDRISLIARAFRSSSLVMPKTAHQQCSETLLIRMFQEALHCENKDTVRRVRGLKRRPTRQLCDLLLSDTKMFKAFSSSPSRKGDKYTPPTTTDMLSTPITLQPVQILFSIQKLVECEQRRILREYRHVLMSHGAVPGISSSFFHLKVDLQLIAASKDDGITAAELQFIIHYLTTLQQSYGLLNHVNALVAAMPVAGPFGTAVDDLDDCGGEDIVTILQNVNCIGELRFHHDFAKTSKSINDPIIEDLIISKLLPACATLTEVYIPPTAVSHSVLQKIEHSSRVNRRRYNQFLELQKLDDANKFVDEEIVDHFDDGGHKAETIEDTDFFVWENTARVAIYVCEEVAARKLFRREYATKERLHSGHQAHFTSSLFVKQRSEFCTIVHVEILPRNVFARELRHRSTIYSMFVEDEESIARTNILRSLRRMEEQMQREMHEDLVLVKSKLKRKRKLFASQKILIFEQEAERRRRLVAHRLAFYFIMLYCFRPHLKRLNVN